MLPAQQFCMYLRLTLSVSETLRSLFNLYSTMITSKELIFDVVRPQNLLGDWQQIAMQGAVVNSFANINAVTGRCQTPISPRMDSDSNETCTNIDQAGGAYVFSFCEGLYLYLLNGVLDTIITCNTCQSGQTPLYIKSSLRI